MSTLSPHVDVEEIQTTKSEKLLAVVLAAFLLVGALWAYQKVDDTIRAAVEPAVAAPADRAAVDRLDAASARLFEAEEVEQLALEQLEASTGRPTGPPSMRGRPRPTSSAPTRTRRLATSRRRRRSSTRARRSPRQLPPRRRRTRGSRPSRTGPPGSSRLAALGCGSCSSSLPW